VIAPVEAESLTRLDPCRTTENGTDAIFGDEAVSVSRMIL
jgi:hypothetical protein